MEARKTPQFGGITNNPNKIRNVSLIGNLSNGKTALFNIFERFCNYSPDQPPHPKMTITPVFISRLTLPNSEFDEHLVNLFDTPGHFDFDWEVSACLRLSDGVIIVVDCVEGVCLQAETLIKRAVKEQMQICLIINKVDLLFTTVHLSSEAIYVRFCEIINTINSLILENKSGSVDILSVTKGNVAFASLKDGWCFTLKQIAKIYEKKNNSPGLPETVMEKLWGNKFVNTKTHKVLDESKIQTKGPQWVRGFCQYVLDPVRKVYENSASDKTKLSGLLRKLEVYLDAKEIGATSAEELVSIIMKNWLPVNICLMELIINQIPSPKQCQQNRISALYPPNSLSEYDKAKLEQCDENGKLMLYFSQRIADPSAPDTLLLLGRVFSGAVSTGDEVFLVDTSTNTRHTISNIFLNTPQLMRIQRAPAGSVIAIGIDIGSNDKTPFGTLSDHCDVKPMKRIMKFNPPTLQQYVETNDNYSVNESFISSGFSYAFHRN